LKLVGDQHLARLYTAATRRFHLADWDCSILRKLHTVEGLYQKLADEKAIRRMEVPEGIIIVLIAVSIVLPFFPGLRGKRESRANLERSWAGLQYLYSAGGSENMVSARPR